MCLIFYEIKKGTPMKYQIYFLISLLLAKSAFASDISQYTVDFHASMGKDHPIYAHYYEKGMQSAQAQKILQRLETIYTKNIFTNIAPSTTAKIPKIVHQIWLGSPLPERFKSYTESWRIHHPDWEYKLWNDADIAALHLENEQEYNKAINYAERSDIARYEILYRFGGLYVDTDCQCIQPLDMLHHYYDFYSGLELPAMALFLQPIIMPNALIACAPGHIIMRTCMDRIKQNSTGSSDVVIKTGPLMFTKSVLDMIDTGSTTDMIFPATFFYPIDKNVKGQKQIQELCKPETFAVHHWAGSWILKEEAFVPGIKIRSKIVDNTIRFTIVDER